MVVVLHGLEIHQQRRMAVDAQGGGGQQRSLKAVPFALAQHALGRPRGVCVLVLERVNELLDAHRRPERAQGAQIGRRQAEAFARASRRSRIFQGQIRSSIGESRRLYRFEAMRGRRWAANSGGGHLARRVCYI